MKKLFSALLCLTMLLTLAACGKSDVAGTWYSTVDATMYNFADGEITVSGITVGQYEDNGDSLVVSMINDGSNLQLYVTTLDGIDVLADVKKGDGVVYFCKGLENAHAIMETTALNEFKSYLAENLTGTWEVWDVRDEDAMVYVKFSDDRIQTENDAGSVRDYHISAVEYAMVENEPTARFSTYIAGFEESPIEITLTPIDYETHELRMDGNRWLIKSE